MKKNKYYQKIEIPIRFIKKIDKNGYIKKNIKKTGYLALLSALILIQIQGLSGFEAHVINITARICSYSETRTMGYWKNHPEVYFPFHLPQTLGNESVDTPQDVDLIFDNANAKEMRDMLKAQLLAMKFNIAHFGIGEYFVESEGKTLNEIVLEADHFLVNPNKTREELERMKTLLDNINNLHRIKVCSDASPETNFVNPAIQPAFTFVQNSIPEPVSIIDTATPSDNGVIEPSSIIDTTSPSDDNEVIE